MIYNSLKVVQQVLLFELRQSDCGKHGWYHYATESLETHASFLKYQTSFNNILLLF